MSFIQMNYRVTVWCCQHVCIIQASHAHLEGKIVTRDTPTNMTLIYHHPHRGVSNLHDNTLKKIHKPFLNSSSMESSLVSWKTKWTGWL